MRQFLNIFSDPSKYDLYKAGKYAIANMSELKSRGAKALNELERGKCARCGFAFGKIMREIVQSDDSLASIVWGQALSLASEIGQVAGSVYNKVTDFWDEL